MGCCRKSSVTMIGEETALTVRRARATSADAAQERHRLVQIPLRTFLVHYCPVLVRKHQAVLGLPDRHKVLSVPPFRMAGKHPHLMHRVVRFSWILGVVLLPILLWFAVASYLLQYPLEFPLEFPLELPLELPLPRCGDRLHDVSVVMRNNIKLCSLVLLKERRVRAATTSCS